MARETARVGGLADRYASALFELGKDEGELDRLAGDLSRLQDMLDGSKDMVRLVRSPVISRAEQGSAMAALIDKAGMCDLTRRFVGLLAQKRRLFALSQMISAFRERLARHRGEVSAEVSTATPLKPRQLDAIEDALKAGLGRDVTVESRVDESLIGGLILRVGSRMIDDSIRTKLRNLKLAMKEVG